MKKNQSTLMGIAKAGSPSRPLTTIQNIIDAAIKMMRKLGVEHRQDIESWADAAAETAAKAIPDLRFRIAVVFIAPRMIDMALDAAFGPDDDNT